MSFDLNGLAVAYIEPPEVTRLCRLHRNVRVLSFVLFSDIIRMRGLLAVSAWLCASQLSLAAPSTSFETVETENGRITGHRAPKANVVWEYLGIPYAQPPLGDLRFAAPQKYKGKGPYTAAKFVGSFSPTVHLRPLC